MLSTFLYSSHIMHFFECSIFYLRKYYGIRVFLKSFTDFFTFLPRFVIWNTMMGTSILSIPWGIKQVKIWQIYAHENVFGNMACSSFFCSVIDTYSVFFFPSKQAGFTSGVILIVLMGILTLYCCYRVVKSRKMIRKLHNANISTKVWNTDF